MKTMFEILKVIHKKHTQDQWDTVWAVVADEGTGKSYFSMILLDYWVRILNGKVLPNDVRHMCMNAKQFVSDLKDLKKYDMTVYDEAGELTNRRAMSDLNVRITQAYKIIRGDNLFTILVLPSLWDLDPFFVKRRLRGLVWLDRRRHFQFWGKERLRRMVAINSKFYWKSYSVVKPTHRGYVPTYRGVLLKPYEKKKEEHTMLVRKELYEQIEKGTTGSDDKYKAAVLAVAEKIGSGKAAELFGINRKTIFNYKKLMGSGDGKIT